MAECEAVKQRKELTKQILRACYTGKRDDLAPGITGTEQQLTEWFSVLTGIVNEYHDGGDQMVEECTCGEHRQPVAPQSLDAAQHYEQEDR